MCNQLQLARPFVEDDENVFSKKNEKLSNDDEGVTLEDYDHTEFSSTSSIMPSEECKQNPSTSSIDPSYGTTKDELKYHYYGFCRSLDNLIFLANGVRDKYHKGCN